MRCVLIPTGLLSILMIEPMCVESVLYPVILRVPNDKQTLSPREKVRFLSAYAHDAARASARKNALLLDRMAKNDLGAPLPFQGTYWSVSHKSGYVAGIAAPFPIGIDVEQIRPINPRLFSKIATEQEWNLGRKTPEDLFFRYWTAKEAVLKTAGVGITHLSRCRVSQIVDERFLMVAYMEASYQIEHYVFDGHIAAIVKQKGPVRWCHAPDTP